MNERETLELIDERDRFEEMADALAYEIGRVFSIEIGEHSNVNNPQQNALDYLRDVKLTINIQEQPTPVTSNKRNK